MQYFVPKTREFRDIKRKLKRWEYARIAKRRKWIKENPELAEIERIQRVEAYLSKKNIDN